MTEKSRLADNDCRFQLQCAADHLAERIETDELLSGDRLALKLQFAQKSDIAQGVIRHIARPRHCSDSFGFTRARSAEETAAEALIEYFPIPLDAKGQATAILRFCAGNYVKATPASSKLLREFDSGTKSSGSYQQHTMLPRRVQRRTLRKQCVLLDFYHLVSVQRISLLKQA